MLASNQTHTHLSNVVSVPPFKLLYLTSCTNHLCSYGLQTLTTLWNSLTPKQNKTKQNDPPPSPPTHTTKPGSEGIFCLDGPKFQEGKLLGIELEVRQVHILLLHHFGEELPGEGGTMQRKARRQIHV